MLRKSVGLLSLSLVVLGTACKQESIADKITEEDMKAIQTENAIAGRLAKAEFDKEVHDFGTIAEGAIVETEFMVKNTGDSDLMIYEAKGSCGCTVPQPPKEPIKPGESAPIKVSFDSKGKPGAQEKTVTLKTNTANGHEMFKIKANVTPAAK
ncbi:DUF1573 domain-containing protein [Flavobacterium sp.]|jgi:hypothetical protein|uniref:DUF1573 domain-containing protein n=1 Tax=Flavobacterium sp. TaxID=239 RepID=UPI0027431724|nr:DUF1573 domain-containing protein [Flavobacterium sp.]MDP5026886.1 DUF1573 domain-containing protein [Flavobacterium sp.]MDP5097297.1 DUF1573 domain-containing protein [Flavobacterium sp.]